MAIKNMVTSVLTRLKNQSKEEGIPFQMVLQLLREQTSMAQQQCFYQITRQRIQITTTEQPDF